MWSIANRFGTTVNEIKSLNNLTSNNLSIGQVLKLPVSSTGTDNLPMENTYVVKSGDSLWNIANRFGTTVNEIKSLNNLTSNNLSIGQVLKLPVSSTEADSLPTENTYVVKSGDSLWNIANRFGTTVNEIRSLNNLTSNNLSIGQVLKLPTNTSNMGNTYVVKSGDSLWNIANRFGTTVSELKLLNNLVSNSLSIGQVLRLP